MRQGFTDQMSHSHELPRLPRRVGFLINVTLGLLFAFFAQWLPSSEGGKRIVTRIWGPLVTQYYPSSGRDQVTVMLIDDLDLHQYEEMWPVSLGFHQRRLQQLLKYGPKAVFFDIAFLDDRRDADLDGFIDTACRARQQGVPVFIGSFANAGLSPSRVEAEMLGRRVEVHGRSQPCIEAAYLNLKIDGFDQSVWEYDVGLPPGGAHRGEGEHGHHAAGPRYPSPAARLFAVDHRLDAEVLAEPMALVWGMESDPFNLGWMRNQTHDVGDGPLCAGAWNWERVLPFGKMGPPLCPYQRTLPMRTLNRANGLGAEDLRDALAGKYVIYGTHLQSTADTVTSPYHGRIAGAYVHAMALDNLLAFEGKPRRAGEFGEPGSGEVTAFTVFAVVVICGFIAFKERFSAKLEKRKHQSRKAMHMSPGENRTQPTTWRRMMELSRVIGHGIRARLVPALLFTLSALVLVMVLIYVSYSLLRLGPMVWVEYALFPLGMHFLHIGEKIEEAIVMVRTQWKAGADPHARAAP
jgi:hypothetical protein